MHTEQHQDSPEASDNHTVPTEENVENTQSEKQSSNAPEKKMSVKSLVGFVLLVLIIVIPIRIFIAKPFIVSGTSMYPTFNSFHYIIVDQLSYRFHKPLRGDVITFRFPQNPSKFLIKRIIGLPNETVRLVGTNTIIENAKYPKGFTLSEPYVAKENEMESSMTVHLGNNEYFVMGDNRKVSADSRYWGPLERNRIVGRAYIRLFPFSKIGILPGATSYEIPSPLLGTQSDKK